jgi:hypothetical protein
MIAQMMLMVTPLGFSDFRQQANVVANRLSGLLERSDSRVGRLPGRGWAIRPMRAG